MAKKPEAKDPQDALNHEGVFFKKRGLAKIKNADGIGVFSEEFGVTFGERVAGDARGCTLWLCDLCSKKSLAL